MEGFSSEDKSHSDLIRKVLGDSSSEDSNSFEGSYHGEGIKRKRRHRFSTISSSENDSDNQNNHETHQRTGSHSVQSIDSSSYRDFDSESSSDTTSDRSSTDRDESHIDEKYQVRIRLIEWKKNMNKPFFNGDFIKKEPATFFHTSKLNDFNDLKTQVFTIIASELQEGQGLLNYKGYDTPFFVRRQPPLSLLITSTCYQLIPLRDAPLKELISAINKSSFKTTSSYVVGTPVLDLLVCYGYPPLEKKRTKLDGLKNAVSHANLSFMVHLYPVLQKDPNTHQHQLETVRESQTKVVSFQIKPVDNMRISFPIIRSCVGIQYRLQKKI